MWNIKMSYPPVLDPGMIPAALWNREYRNAVKATGHGVKLALSLERSESSISRFDTEIFPETPEYEALNFFYVERLVKFLLWSFGGWKLTVGGSSKIAQSLRQIYCADGARGFDYAIVGKRIYDREFTIAAVPLEAVPTGRERSLSAGTKCGGCRVGFDLGGSNRKCAAVIDGKVIHTEEVAWDPYFQNNLRYHIREICDSIHRAAAKLPRIDAIGGSAAGVLVDSQPRISSLFRGIADSQNEQVRLVFQEVAKEFPGIPLVVANDGEVTALAGAIHFGKTRLLGLSMGTSEAVGYVGADGAITDHLNELAFAPIDYRANAPRDEWSGDMGVGVCYLSQQSLMTLSRPSGIAFHGKTVPEQFRELRDLMDSNYDPARLIYQSIGSYLGYALAHYSDFFDFENLLLLGGVSAGRGGDILIDAAQRVLRSDFPLLNITFLRPDETFKRHGQAVAAASLPILPQR